MRQNMLVFAFARNYRIAKMLAAGAVWQHSLAF